MKISVVIPVYNEEDSILELKNRLNEVLADYNSDFEVIFIDDGSTDSSIEILRVICNEDKRYRVIRFFRNYGQTAAMQAGFESANGDLIITLDADLQNNPEDIPLLIKELQDKKADVVSGWRYDRKDKIIRKFVSSIANSLISRITGLKLHDFGCTLKIYRSKFIDELRLYGEMHRFIPVFIHWNGGKIVELKVSHCPRRHGRSSYGMGRIYRVILDMITTKFLTTYSSKPNHVFGAIGLSSIGLGILTGIYVIMRKIYLGGVYMSPLFFVSVFMMGMGLMLIFMGIIAEIAVRIYFSQNNNKPFRINEEN